MNFQYIRFHKHIIHVIYSSLDIIHLLPLSAILVLKFNVMHVWISIWMYFHFIHVVHLMHEHSSIFHKVSIWPTIYMVNYIYECTIQFICIENFIQKIIHQCCHILSIMDNCIFVVNFIYEVFFIHRAYFCCWCLIEVFIHSSFEFYFQKIFVPFHPLSLTPPHPPKPPPSPPHPQTQNFIIT